MSSGQQLLIVHVPNQPFERRSSAVAFANQCLAHVQPACQGGESNGIVYGVDPSGVPNQPIAEWFFTPAITQP